METLQRMSLEESKKYQKYKYKDLKKGFIISVILLPVLIAGVGATSLLVVEAYRKIYLLVAGVGGSLGVMVIIFVHWKQIKSIKTEPGTPYEYAITEVEYGKKVQLDRGDGEKHFYYFKEQEHSVFRGEKKALIIYIPQENLTFAEKIEVWDKIKS